MVILIDNGSNHSFVDSRLVRSIGYPSTKAKTLWVTVANGPNMISRYTCEQFRWKMQEHEFDFNFRVLKLGGHDMVLGVYWMKLHSPMIFNFANMKMSFKLGAQQVELIGTPEKAALKSITCKKLQKMIKKGWAM